ncbi:MAG: MerR family transcriptional regulator [Candidatus Cloacimonetes bacterium]|nr:MerR family transcriptional regulator [Candidatus Cloacimonadota bacterium]
MSKNMNWFNIKNQNYWRVSGKKDYTIQEVAELTGITVRTLRNYLKSYEELVQPKRGYYNSLIFSKEDINCFVMIKTLIKDGFKKEEIVTKVQSELEQIVQEEKTAEVKSETIPKKDAVDPPLAEDKTLAQTVTSLAVEDSSNESQFNYQEMVEYGKAIKINHGMLEKMNQHFLNLETRNSMLEQKIDRIERLLVSKEEAESNQHHLPKSISTLIDSTQAFWKALKNTIH